MWDVTPFLMPGDPWAEGGDPEWVRNYYARRHAFALLTAPDRVLEFGVRAGCSMAAFLSARPQARYLGIDLDEPGHGWAPGALEHARAIAATHFPGRAEIIVARSQDWRPPLAGVWDLVHVDGEHTLEGCRGDLLVARMAARPGGWVLVDDVDHVPGVAQAAWEYLGEHPEWPRMHFPGGYGDLLFRVGA